MNLKAIVISLAASALLACGCVNANAQDKPLRQAQDRPNVVFLLSDDQGWMDYGFMGHPHVQTPHLDRLASEGLLYERGYVTARFVGHRWPASQQDSIRIKRGPRQRPGDAERP